jgi:hypothetical protein
MNHPTPSTSPERCETCGNLYDKAIHVTVDGVTHAFDCFECAIQALAPVCAHCRCRIVGHGVEDDGVMFCCAHCARESGTSNLRDRVQTCG